MPEISMTETLFGGLLVLIALFLLVTRLGLAKFWATIFAVAVPSLCYLRYASQQQVGGDVIAIHLVVYLATGAVIFVFSGMRGQKKQAMHWAPKLIIGFFVTLVILNAAFLSMAMHGLPDSVANLLMPDTRGSAVHTAFPGVVPHDANHLYEPHLRQLAQQQQLGWSVQLHGFEHMIASKPQTISLILQDAKAQALTGANVQMNLWRMADSRDDKSITLQPSTVGQYEATITLPDYGRWFCEITITRGDDVYYYQQEVRVSQ